jgi:hypothetical protein
MDFLNRDVVRQIALNLDIEDIYNLCLTSTLFNKNICNEDNFWHERIRLEFPNVVNNFQVGEIKKAKNMSWKQYYQKLNPSKVFRVNYVIDTKIESKWIGRNTITGKDIHVEEIFEIPRIVKNNNHFDKQKSVKKDENNSKQMGFRFSSYDDFLQFEKEYLNLPKYLVFIEEHPETAFFMIVTRNGKIQGDFSKMSEFLKDKEVSFMFHEEYNKVFDPEEDIDSSLAYFVERKLRNRKGYIVVNGQRLPIVGIKLPDNFSELQ